MHENSRPRRPRSSDGFTLIELLIVVVLIGVLVGMGAEGMRAFARSSTVQEAAEAVAADVSLARLLALQRRETVEVSFDESARSYVIWIPSLADTLETRSYDGGDLPLAILDVRNGNTLRFDSRGVLAAGTTVRIDLESRGETRQVAVSALGKTKVLRP